MSELRTDFKDDILDVTQNEKRKYRIIHNEDGTISLEDATVYLQKGDSFGANDLNEMNRMANQMNEAAGEILTMADDIDTLQEDVETLTPRVEVLENTGSNNLIWDISNELYSESRDVSTLPRDITNGYVVKLNDIFYMLGGGNIDTSSNVAAQKTYKYVNDAWVEDTVLGALSIHKSFTAYNGGVETIRDLCAYTTGGAVSNNKTLYYTQYSKNAQESRCYAAVYTYNGTSKSFVGQYFGYSDSSYYRYGNVAIAPNSSSYKTLSYSQNASYSAHQYALNTGSTSSGGSVELNSLEMGSYIIGSDRKVLQPHNQGVIFEGFYTFLISQRDIGNIYTSSNNSYTDYIYKYYLVQINSNSTIRKTILLPDHMKLVTDMVCINGYIYITYNDGFVWRYKDKWEKVVNIGSGSLIEHEGEIHRFTGTSWTAHKLYREAKTYAPKNTKIYLPYESKALSDNLVAIDGGYLVTESGNISIGMYDY